MNFPKVLLDELVLEVELVLSEEYHFGLNEVLQKVKAELEKKESNELLACLKIVVDIAADHPTYTPQEIDEDERGRTGIIREVS